MAKTKEPENKISAAIVLMRGRLHHNWVSDRLELDVLKKELSKLENADEFKVIEVQVVATPEDGYVMSADGKTAHGGSLLDTIQKLSDQICK